MSRRRTPARAIHRALAADPGRSGARQQTRGLTEGAILAALTAVIATAGLVIPPVAILLAPLPVMLLVIRWGLRTGVLATVVASLILLQIFGPLVALSVVGFGPIGLALGWGVRHERGAAWTVLAGAAALYASTLASLGLAIAVLHQNVLTQFIQLQIEAMRHSIALMERLGTPPQNIEPLRLLAEGQCGEHHCSPALFAELVTNMSPVLLAFGALFWGYLCYTIGRSLLRRLGYQVPAVPPMLTWRLPRRLAASLVWISGGLSLAGLWVPELSSAVMSAVIVNLFVFGFLGTLVAVTWMNKRQVPTLLQVSILVLVIGSQSYLAFLALAVFGMLDTWHDYRRLATASPPPAVQDPDPGSATQSNVPAAQSNRKPPKAVSPR